MHRMDKSKFLFDHIYKAGGTSIEKAFVEWIGKENMSPGLVCPASDAIRQYQEKKLVSGHFSFSPSFQFGADRYVFTMLRHPIDRIISHYYFARNDVGLRAGDVSVELTKSMSLSEYVHSEIPEIRNHLVNFQARHFAPIAWNGTEDLTDAKTLELAKQALEHYDLVGVFDEFEDFLVVLSLQVGWRPLEKIPHANSTSRRPKLQEIQPEVLSRLAEINSLDIALYQHATKLFHKKRLELMRRCILAPATVGNELVGLPSVDACCDISKSLLIPTKLTEYGDRRIELLQAYIVGDISLGAQVLSGEVVRLRIEFRAHHLIDNLIVGIAITDRDGRKVYGANLKSFGQCIDIESTGDYYAEFRFRCDLGFGFYKVDAALHPADDLSGKVYHWREGIADFSVEGNIGYYFEGGFKLYPTLECDRLEDSPEARLVVRDLNEYWPRLQSIAIHSPPLQEFNASIGVVEKLERMKVNEVIVLELEICNTSSQAWTTIGLRSVSVSYHWLDQTGEMFIFDGERTKLPRDIQAGQKFRLWTTVKAPSMLGCFTLVLSLVQDYVAWFDEMGCPTTTIQVRIE